MSVTSNTVLCSDMFVHPQALVEASDIGRGTRVWAFAHVMAGAHIGSSCNICDHAFIESGATLGNNVTVKNGVALWEGVTIEDNVFLGPYCVFINDPNPRAYLKKRGTELLETQVQANATVGSQCNNLVWHDNRTIRVHRCRCCCYPPRPRFCLDRGQSRATAWLDVHLCSAP
jgi:UDP-3-O-[3-hydroxymyristoyl] glucosamine N-acyltransferase